MGQVMHLGPPRPRPSSLPSSTASGRYLASRLPLAGHGQVERVIHELRGLLDAKCEGSASANRDDLVHLWMSVESSLTSEEHQQLFPVVLERPLDASRGNIRARACCEKKVPP